MKLRYWIVACVMGVAANTVDAALIPLTARLDGAQEAPQVVSSFGQTQAEAGGFGFAFMAYDDVANILLWMLLFDLNTGPATAAHFHGATNPGDPAGVGLASPVRITIANVAGLSDGVVFGFFDLDNLTNAADNEANLLGGLWYINIHTSVFPSGEIRGQVVRAVPEPLTLSLLGASLMLLVVLQRRALRR